MFNSGLIPKELKGSLKGFIGAATLLLVVVLVVVLAALTWPVCLLLAVAGAVRLVARLCDKRRSSKFAKAVVSVTFPYVCGFACVAVLQLGFNLARLRPDNVAGVEDWILRQSDRIGLLNRVTWWEYVAILIVLGAVGAAAPRLRLLSRFVGAVKVVEAVSGVLATVTAFTFVTAAVGDSYLRDSEAKFRAQLAGKVREKRKVMADTLVNQVVAQSLERLPPASVPMLAAIEAQLHASEASHSAADDLLDIELGEQIRSGEKPPPAVEAPAPPPKPEARGAELLRRPAVENRETGEARVANKASETAIEAALDRVADSASDSVRGRVRDVLEQIVGGEIGPLLKAMIDLGDGFTSEYLSQVREPLMKKANAYCDRMAERIANLGRPVTAAATVRTRARSDALDEAIRLEDDKRGNEVFERLGKATFSREARGPADRTGDVTHAIDIAIDLTPGAGRVEWGNLLPSAAAFADPELERAVEGVAGFHKIEMERIEIAKRQSKDSGGDDKVGEIEHGRPEPMQHEIP